MDPLSALLLGVLQGLTEFLPVSSSGHLALAEHWLGLSLTAEEPLLLNILSHLGTLLVIVISFRADLKSLFLRRSPLRVSLLLGTLPLFFFVPLYSLIRKSFGELSLLSLSFAFTGSYLLLGERLRSPFRFRRLEPLWIGLSQTLALLPGISRSGMTLSTARMLGWQTEEAIRFSFLLAVPATLGALLLELGHLWQRGELPKLPLLPLFTLVGSSFAVGLFSLRLLKRLGERGWLSLLGLYCLLLSLLTLYLL